jgi:hypothetical protein
LLGELFNIVALSPLDELGQSSGHQFSASTVGIGFQTMPVTVIKTQATMKVFGKFRSGFWPA